jgi:SWIM zinc finger
MKVIEEITEWDSEYSVPNHVYFVNDSQDKMFAYVAAGSVRVQEFKQPIKFSTIRRRFREVENRWGYAIPEAVKPEGQAWTVSGSKGATYTVTNAAGSWTCTCPAAKWQRGECKHIVKLKTKS